MTRKIKLPEELENTIKTALAGHRRFRLGNIGLFEVRKVKERELFHNFSGKIITIPKHFKVYFKPSLTVKKTL